MVYLLIAVFAVSFVIAAAGFVTATTHIINTPPIGREAIYVPAAIISVITAIVLAYHAFHINNPFLAYPSTFLMCMLIILSLVFATSSVL